MEERAGSQALALDYKRTPMTDEKLLDAVHDGCHFDVT